MARESIIRRTDPGQDRDVYLVQLRDRSQLIFVETEVPDVKVFRDTRRRDGFRDHHQTAIKMPADDDLRRRFAVLIGELVDDFLIEDAFAARASGLRDSVWILWVAFHACS